MKIRTYSELLKYSTFLDRYHYLELGGRVGESTFGFDRYLNQVLYHSKRWRLLRSHVIVRDNGCDLAMEGYEIGEYITVHHLNQVTIEDIERESDWIYDPEFVVCTADLTHKAIHYGDESLLPQPFVERSRYDTAPWRQH